MKPYRPSPPADVREEHEGGRSTLVFVRELPHPPQRVWTALTDTSELAQWSPFDADRDLGSAGAATLTMAGGDGTETSAVTVRRAEPPVLLEYTWDEDVIRWELEATDGGTRLTLRHTVADRGWLARVAGGWHVCLDVAERLMAGQPVGRIVGEDAKAYGWEELHATYAERLGVTKPA